MEYKNENAGFQYTYSAKEQDEIKRIRQKYQSKEEEGMTKLRKLDASVTKKATMVSLIIGIVGALILGMGMSLIMTDIGSYLGVSGIKEMLIGIIIGLIGIILVVLAYPVHCNVLKKERERVASEILKLTDELMK